MKILLIAGHGQGDPGACGCGYQEATLTREVVSLVEARLKNYATVIVADTSLNWFNNKSKLPLSGVDYVLEIHFNACVNDQSGNGKTTGTEIYVTRQESGTTVEAAIVANIAALGLKNRGVKRYNWSVINYVKNKGISSALLETCFIDDADDMKIYAAKKSEIANAIVSGIVTGFGLAKETTEDKTETGELTTVNDIVWELAHRGIITDEKLWLKKLEEDSNAYWLARKTVKFLQSKGV